MENTTQVQGQEKFPSKRISVNTLVKIAILSLRCGYVLYIPAPLCTQFL